MNQFKSEKETEKKEPKKKFKLPKSLPFEWTTQRKRSLGIVLLLMAVYFFFAFLSYIINFSADFGVVQNQDGHYIRSINPKLVSNWMGYLGAWIGQFFIYKSFGIAAFLLPFYVGKLGLKLAFDIEVPHRQKTNQIAIFSALWLPIALSLLAKGRYDFLAGAFGVYTMLWLKTVIGSGGLVLLLAGSLIAFLLLVLNFDLIDNIFNGKAKKPNQPKAETEDDGFTHTNVTKESTEVKKAFDKDPPFKPLRPQQKVEEDDDLDFSIEISPEVTKALEEKNKAAKQSNPQPPLETEDEGLIIERVTSQESHVDRIENHNKDYDPTLDLSNYQYPNLDLLEQYEQTEAVISKKEIEDHKNLIVETLGNYKIDIAKVKATVGPTVTLFEIVPAPGVRISKIKNLEDDIALSLAALGIRIIAPIPGKGTVGIEVPNEKPKIVSMHDVMSSSKFQNTEMELPIAFGRTISNEVFITDLTKMPHLLMAGATGQGKSVGLNAIIASILYKKHPSQVKFVMVDPKKVELSLYKLIEKHFLAKLPDDGDAVITDTSKVINTLQSLCLEMDQRYDLLKDAQVRNIKEYNQKFLKRKLNPEKGHRYLPYIVLIIDELADLMMTAGKEVEMPIARLAQLARAIGIHLVVATQRPSVNIITGIIKANFPARLAFRVTSKVDSRTILDTSGADQLIGRGDMLFTTGGDLLRVQCAFLDTPEVESICEFIGDQQSYGSAFMLPEAPNDNSSASRDGSMLDKDSVDPMFDDAARTIVQNQMGSTSLLQRRLKLGYNRAGRLIDQLEKAGIVGQHEGSKAREVLIPDEHSLEQFLNDFHKNR